MARGGRAADARGRGPPVTPSALRTTWRTRMRLACRVARRRCATPMLRASCGRCTASMSAASWTGSKVAWPRSPPASACAARTLASAAATRGTLCCTQAATRSRPPQSRKRRQTGQVGG
jgi:hypothetical protein